MNLIIEKKEKNKNKMKKIFSLICVMFLTMMALCAEESILLTSSTPANLGEGIEYTKNFNATSKSGYFGGSLCELKSLEPSEKGFSAMATNVPKDTTTNYVFEAPYPSFINTNEDGSPVEGAGFIENVGDIVSFEVSGVLLNRPYDTLYLMYSTSPFGEIKKVKLVPVNKKEDGTFVKNVPVSTMTETTFIWENDNYNSNVKTRKIKSDPALGADNTGIYFRGLLVQANPSFGSNEYSPWSIAYFKEIKATYDLRFTPEQWASRKEMEKEWNVDNGETKIREVSKEKVLYRKKLEETEAAKMHNVNDAK